MPDHRDPFRGGRTVTSAPSIMARRRAGFTLLEMSLYMAILSTLALSVTMISVGISRTTEESQMISRILERNRVTLKRISDDYRRCILSTSSVTNGGRTLTFTLPAGYDGSAPIHGATISYSILPDPTDAANGLDDDGDGIVDEAILSMRNLTTGETMTISADLEYISSQFFSTTGGVWIRLTHMGWVKGSSKVTRISKFMLVYARN